MNDALLSNSLDFASVGLRPLITLWAKTRGNLDVRGVCAMNTMPLYLNARDPKVKNIKDFTDQDRVALPAVKVSFQAVNLQMAAAKAFGTKQYNKLDKLTVSLSHPDGMAALLSPASEIYRAFLAAFEEAIAQINHDKPAAARNYIAWANYKGPADLPLKTLDDPLVKFTTTPHRITTYADFMYQIGSIKVKPKSWKDMFFPEVRPLHGS